MSAAEQDQPQDAVTITPKDGGFIVEGGAFADPAARWTALPLDGKRVLFTSDEGKTGLPGLSTGMASCKVELFKDFLIGLHHAGWTGLVSADTGYGLKKVYFARGQLVFAGSNVMDDRLGEVIFRESRISL